MEFLDPTICGWDVESNWLIFSDNVFGNFIYYSHLLPVLCSILLVGTLWWQNRYNSTTQALMFMTLMFTAWSFTDLVLWATANPVHTMFFWSIILHFEVLIYVGALYFTNFFVNKRGLSWKQEAFLLTLYLPLIIFSHTTLNLEGFDYTNCNREAVEGPLVGYAYLLEIFIALWILHIGFRYIYRRQNRARYAEVLLGTLGTALFLISFSLGNIIGTIGVDWELGQYGLFGLPLFVALLVYLTIRYNSLNVKLYSAQASILGIFVLVVSLLFVRDAENIRIITLITAPVVLLLGFLLMRSVKREIEQKRIAQELATELAGANVRLERLDKMKSEFVSIASHQLRSPLTSVRGYISMVLEGSYGEINPKAKEVLMHVSDAARHMALSIEDYLNVSRIEAGNMKYDISDVDLSQLTRDIVTEMLPVGEKRGIPITFETRFPGSAVVKLDAGKTRQIVQNLIDNALKYTKDKGTVRVILRKDEAGKQVFIDVADQGIGIDPEGLKALFEKFERAKNASHTNVSGTGLGLYIARMMARAMDGDITAASEGEGKGSVFTIRFPLNGIESKWIHGR